MSQLEFVRRMAVLAAMVLAFVVPGVALDWIINGHTSLLDAAAGFMTSPLLWFAVVAFWFVAGVLLLVIFFGRNSFSAWEDDRLG